MNADAKEMASLQRNAQREAIESLKRRIQAAEYLLHDPLWENKQYARQAIFVLSGQLAELVLSQ